MRLLLSILNYTSRFEMLYISKICSDCLWTWIAFEVFGGGVAAPWGEAAFCKSKGSVSSVLWKVWASLPTFVPVGLFLQDLLFWTDTRLLLSWTNWVFQTLTTFFKIRLSPTKKKKHQKPNTFNSCIRLRLFLCTQKWLCHNTASTFPLRKGINL